MIKSRKTLIKSIKPKLHKKYDLPPFELGLTPEAEEELKKYSIKDIAEREIAEKKREKEEAERAKSKKLKR